ncbi:MAG: hypothetical protein IKC91_04970 [Clostridia bacterium]|nr:hypothetical protein [Clostridia bacterium]
MNTRVVKTISRTALFVFLLCVLLLFSCFPKRYMDACLHGVSLWATCVLPSTLPFLFVTGLITRLGFVNKLSKWFTPVTEFLFALSGVSGYCLMMSFLSGYPVGAKTLSDLKEQGVISRSEATKMSFICSSSGPLFILGSVGMGMFCSAVVGGILLLSHFAAIVLSGIVFRFYKATPAKGYLPALGRTDNLLYECMYSSVISVLCVGGFIAVFFTLSQILTDWHVLSPLSALISGLGADGDTAKFFAQGLIEMTGGCSHLATNTLPLNVGMCAFLITFGGVSILVQQILFLQKAEVKLGIFFAVKLLQAAVAGLIAFGLTCLLITSQV